MGKNYIDLGSAILDRCNQKYYDKVLSEYGLGYSQYAFLSAIYENEGLVMNELAANGSYDKGSITKAIAKLEEMDFVRIENSEEDKRAKKLYTTKKAKDLMPKLYLIRQEWVNYLTSDLTDEEIENYSKVMDKLLIKAKEYSSTNLVSEDVHIYGLQKLTLLDYPGKMAATIFTGGCNFRCPFCHNKQLVFLNQNEDEIPASEVLDYLDNRKKLLDGVCVTGGEPLLQEGIENFLREIRKTGLKIKLDTNGSNFEKLKRIVEEGLVDYVAMDIKNEKDNFKVNLTDKQRFGEYTLFHKNHYYDLNNYHTQGKYKDLHFLIFVAATHSINKEVGIKSTAEDWFAFKKDALKYYFERGK